MSMSANNHVRLKRVGIVAGLLALTACGGGTTNETTSTPTPAGMDYTVSLMGAQVIPTGNVEGAAIAASGTAMLHLDDATMRLTGDLSTSALPNITAIHLHSGFAG